MKGVLFIHLRRYLESAYPEVRWNDILSESGITEHFSERWDYPDDMLVSIVETAAQLASASPPEIWYGFGRNSMREFRKNFHWYFHGHSDATSFLRALDATHIDAVRQVPGATPPRFSADVADDGSLTITYRSPRLMLAYLRGAIDGVLEIYGEHADVAVLESGDWGCSVHLQFL